MSQRKQQLLKKHRKNKRLAMLVLLLLIGACSLALSWWCLPAGLLLAWLIHEAWFADHIFYAASDDYQYCFPASDTCQSLKISKGQLLWADAENISPDSTVIAKVQIKSSLLGWLFDPQVLLGDDVQTFEPGARGIRYLNLTGQLPQLQSGLSIRGRFCRLAAPVELRSFKAPQWQGKRIMILAPHADDAELAAFGLYSQAKEVSIVTLTQGEIEAEHYQQMGLNKAEAAKLKGRLRSWDSMTIAQWGGVLQQNCVQLGYYCLQLPAMREQPEAAFGSRESGEIDIRSVRHWNSLQLPGDSDGVPSWNNLIADLVGCLQHFRPQIVIMPHPQLDPHADHIATGQALQQALEQLDELPEQLLLYANHLHDNDRWPMGNAGTGVALPPLVEEGIQPQQLGMPFSLVLTAAQQMDKAMALQMQHDLRPPPPLKRKLRRLIQQLLAGRRWPKTGEDEFMRKAVRRHELFWWQPVQDSTSPSSSTN